MADKPKNIATSVRQQLLNLARTEGQAFDVVFGRIWTGAVHLPPIGVGTP